MRFKPSRILIIAAVWGLVVATAVSLSLALDPTLERIQQKAERAKALVEARAQSGWDISDILRDMEQVKAHLEDKAVDDAERLLDEVLARLLSEQGPAPRMESATDPTTDLFGEPRPVEIRGYDEGLGAMEPFITRDGRYLLFNNGLAAYDAGTGRRNDKNLHYAARIDDGAFQYLGEIEGANSNAFDGGPSLDISDRLYFLSVRRYREELSTIHTARFTNGAATQVRIVTGDISPQRPGWLNMDAEISADGRSLYYTINEWDSGLNIPRSSDLRVARLLDGEFETRSDSDAIFKNLNTDELEYAPSLSADEREIYFTRSRFHFSGGKVTGMTARLFMATRTSTDAPFGEAKRIAAVAGLVEGPTIAPDGMRLYYHKKEGGRFRIYMVERRR